MYIFFYLMNSSPLHRKWVTLLWTVNRPCSSIFFVINILLWLCGFWVKIDTKKKIPTTEVCPERPRAMLEYWYIERGLNSITVINPKGMYPYLNMQCRVWLNLFRFLVWFTIGRGVHGPRHWQIQALSSEGAEGGGVYLPCWFIFLLHFFLYQMPVPLGPSPRSATDLGIGKYLECAFWSAT